MHTVRGVVGAGAGDDAGAVPDRVEHRTQQLDLLVVGGGRRLPGGAREHQAVAAGVDEVGGELLGGRRIERAVGPNGVTMAVSTVPSRALTSIPLVLTGLRLPCRSSRR